MNEPFEVEGKLHFGFHQGYVWNLRDEDEHMILILYSDRFTFSEKDIGKIVNMKISLSITKKRLLEEEKYRHFLAEGKI